MHDANMPIAPSVPQNVRACPTHGACIIDVDAPATGSPAPTLYTATSSPGGFTGTSPSATEPIIVTGLTNGTQYSFTVTAFNGYTSPTSAPSLIEVPFNLGGLKFFGIHSTVTGEHANRIVEFDPFTNLNQVSPLPLNFAMMAGLGTGQKAIVSLNDIFINIVNGTLKDISSWTSLKIALDIDIGRVGSFYLDEPPVYRMVGIPFPFTVPLTPAPGFVSLAMAEQQIQDIINIVKSDYPAIPFTVVFAHPTVQPLMNIPPLTGSDSFLDYVGFDYYDEPWETSWVVSHNIVRARSSAIHPGQKMMLVPQAYRETSFGVSQSDQLQLDNLNKYINVAITDSDVAAMLIFVSSKSLTSTAGLVGMVDMPIVYERCRKIGRQIKYAQNTLATPVPANLILEHTSVVIRHPASGNFWKLVIFTPTEYRMQQTTDEKLATRFRPVFYNDGGFDGFRLIPVSQPELPYPMWKYFRGPSSNCVTYVSGGAGIEANYQPASGSLVNPNIASLNTSYDILTFTDAPSSELLYDWTGCVIKWPLGPGPGGGTSAVEFLVTHF